MKTKQPKVEYQLNSHGAGKHSVILFDRNTDTKLAEGSIVKEVNGWKVICLETNDGLYTDGPQHKTPEAAAEWFATTYVFEKI